MLRNSRSIRYSYTIYQHSPRFIQAALVGVFGMKCYLSLHREGVGQAPLVYFASYPNEIRVLGHIRNNLNTVPHEEISVSLRNCFRPESLTAVFAVIPAIPRLYRFARRLVRNFDFMPACRIFSTVTYYMRFRRLLDEEVQGIFIASHYSPECLGLATAAHQAGKKVLFTNHASAAGETGYVAPLHADLVAVTSQAMGDLYQRNSPQDLNIVPFTISEPQQALQAMKQDAGELTVGIYLTALTDEERLQKIIAEWSGFSPVGRVLIRQHPARVVNADLSRLTSERVPVEISHDMTLREDIARTDIAVCGNSTVVIELLRGGRAVLYDHRLDRLAFDYTGYAGHGLVLPYPEKIDERLFELIQQHYFNERWREKMQYFDCGYQQDERAIAERFAAAVDRILRQERARE